MGLIVNTSNITNTNEILEQDFEKAIKEDNLQVFEQDNLISFQKEIDALIKKGQTDSITQEELDSIEKAKKDLSKLVKKVVVDKKGKKTTVWVKVGEEKKGEKKTSKKEEKSDSIDISKLTTKIKGQLANINLDQHIVIPLSLPKDAKFTKSRTVDLNPDMAAVVAPMFKEIKVKYAWAINEQTKEIHLNLDYKYKHPGGGSNGSTVSMVFDEKGLYKETIRGFNVV